MRLMTSTALVALIAGTAAAQPVRFFAEDFDSLPLKDSVDEGVVATGVWTDVPPAGWTTTFSLPGTGVTEWRGFNFADVDWWALTGGDQRRSEFSALNGGAGIGTVAIADGDEWDDIGSNPDDQYDTTLVSPAVVIPATADRGTLELRFSSSWRPESIQKADVEVSYDGGSTWDLIKRYDTATTTDEPSAENTFALPTPPPVATTVQVRFRYYDADNNWWFAVDNIALAAEGVAATLPPGALFLTGDDIYKTINPEVSWTPAAEADEYLVQVSTTEDFSADVRDYVTADTSIVLPNGSVNTGTRYVRVLARNTNGDTASNTIAIRVINPCRIDFNGDGNKTTLDLIEFINGFRGSACQ